MDYKQKQLIMKKVLIIQGHPDNTSFNFALGAAYKKGVLEAGGDVRELILRDLDFNPNLVHGYNKRTDLEPDLVQAQKDIIWAEHIVLIHPLWWGGVPAILKGFIDRTFLPHFAFKMRENSMLLDKLLKGRTGRIIYTTDQPNWYYRWVNGRPSVNQLKKMTFEFCGIKPTRTLGLAPVRGSSDAKRKKWLDKVHLLGTKMK
ncbi:MAG: NAD(P)H-dependent oxidoreductase [Saprospiraceae bacterium]|nr:NAD(P)H-dependent oxidoreductase [Saprospiraceae bacterium]